MDDIDKMFDVLAIENLKLERKLENDLIFFIEIVSWPLIANDVKITFK